MPKTLNWLQKHVNTGHVRLNVTVQDSDGDSHGKDLTTEDPAVLAAAAALEAAVCAAIGATIVEPPKPAEEAKPEEAKAE